MEHSRKPPPPEVDFPVVSECTTGSDTGSTSVIRSPDDVQFVRSPTGYRQVFEVPDYRFSDIRPDDTVVDIGANVGAFCIRAARLSGKVFAIEPLTAGLLKKNIAMNRVHIGVIECALGDGTPQTVTWDGLAATVRTHTIRDIFETTGGCDFLKCDCEGAEWTIIPEDLRHVRRIEMELHAPPICGPPDMRLLSYISLHYRFEIDRVPCHGPLGLFGFLHATRL